VVFRSVTALSAVLFAAASLWAAPARGNEQDFRSWLSSLRQEAAASGIRPATLDAALANLQPLARVLELDRKQPEKTLTFQEYLQRVVPPQRVELARRKLAENRPLLEKIGGEFGVQPRFIVALWAIESDFGEHMGNFRIIPALATLAYDGRRSEFFRRELMNALKIVDQGHVTPDAMIGSWAGAMGQSQFMPSSFLSYAVDYDGDGRRDIWRTRADVFASIANYLATVGWRSDQTWGREVRVPANFDPGLAGLQTRKPLAAWQQLGVRRADGGELPGRELEASLVLPGGPQGPALLVYDNYRTIMNWNKSLYFASAVGFLADSIDAQ
jgi:membrane-bound lytic murein transglycosylase B